MTTQSNQVPNVQTSEGQAQMKAMGVKPVPVPDDVTRPYWEAAKKHELRIQHCKACDEYQPPPQAQCIQCSSTDLEWSKVSGKGTVFSFIVDRRLMTPGFDQPYAVVQVNPVEAKRNTVRVTTNMRGC